MELKINCDAQVKLPKMSNIVSIGCFVQGYKPKGENLEGNILIHGNYIKDELEKVYDFSEVVPFSILFKNRNYKIETVEVEDFTHDDIINQGADCKFSIVVNYETLSEENILQEINQDDKATDENITQEINQDDDISDEIKEQIKQKYDDLLNEILEVRNDNFLDDIISESEEKDLLEPLEDKIKFENQQEEILEEKINFEKRHGEILNEILSSRELTPIISESISEKKEVVINSRENCSDVRSLLKKINESHDSYRVYYTNSESDIENICKQEKQSIDKVCNENKEFDFINKKRIIIK